MFDKIEARQCNKRVSLSHSHIRSFLISISISDIVVHHDALTKLPSFITNSCSDQLSVSILQGPEDQTEGEQNACASAWQNSILF